MSSKLQIYKAVLNTLNTAKAGSGPLSFVKNIYSSYFTTILQLPAQSFPAIVIEPDNDAEQFFTTGTPPALRSDFKIFVSCIISEGAPGAGLLGDSTQTPPIIGMFEFVDKVKQVLQADMTLGGGIGMQKNQLSRRAVFVHILPDTGM